MVLTQECVFCDSPLNEDTGYCAECKDYDGMRDGCDDVTEGEGYCANH